MLKLKEGYTPRWIVLLIDLVMVAIGISIAYLLRFDFSIPEEEIINLPRVYTLIIGVRLASFLAAKIPWAIIRYTSQLDALRILITI